MFPIEIQKKIIFNLIISFLNKFKNKKLKIVNKIFKNQITLIIFYNNKLLLLQMT
jgi:hypothetical protein